MERDERKKLKKRYLVWLYKTTKEELDRIERKFTQLEIDNLILKELLGMDKNKRLEKFIEEFKAYVQNKEKEGMELKFEDGEISQGFLFLESKLKAIEKTIIGEFNEAALNEIKSLYEKEMTERVLKSAEHK